MVACGQLLHTNSLILLSFEESLAFALVVMFDWLPTFLSYWIFQRMLVNLKGEDADAGTTNNDRQPPHHMGESILSAGGTDSPVLFYCLATEQNKTVLVFSYGATKFGIF